MLFLRNKTDNLRRAMESVDPLALPRTKVSVRHCSDISLNRISWSCIIMCGFSFVYAYCAIQEWTRYCLLQMVSQNDELEL